jgi:osmotically inducible lipoprotein OsmB
MRKFTLAALLSAPFVLSACVGSDLERGVGGAAVGALAASATDNDPLIGAAVGGAAGVYCDNLTPQLCQNN